jgi:excisionase family DNA binding protein
VTRALTVPQILALPAAVDLITTGQALGLSRNTTYAMAKSGTFPLPVLMLGRKMLCRRSDVLRFLGIEDPAVAPAV